MIDVVLAGFALAVAVPVAFLVGRRSARADVRVGIERDRAARHVRRHAALHRGHRTLVTVLRTLEERIASGEEVPPWD